MCNVHSMIKKLIFGVAFGFCLSHCGSAKEAALRQLSERVNSAKACSGENQCVLAGASHCSCDVAVNVSATNDIAALVAEVNRHCSPSEFLGECIAYKNPRCDVDAGQCVADVR